MVLKGANFNPATGPRGGWRARRARRWSLLMTDGASAADLERGGRCPQRPVRRDWGDRDLVARLGRPSRQPSSSTGAPARDLQMVPYRGTTAGADRHHGRQRAVADRSELRAAARGTPTTRPARSGIATAKRSPLAPDVPTMAEAGLPGSELKSWYGVWAPKGTPAEIRQRIGSADGTTPCAIPRSPSG